MNKDELTELAGNPNFISGIYNYCDRWCERCQFTSRCLLYATEKADPDLDDPQVRDITNEKFWRKMHEIFQSTAQMISEWAAEAGVDLDAVDATDELAKRERARNKAKESELVRTAQKYATDVQGWFRDELPAETIHDDLTVAQSPHTDSAIDDVVEIIRWYQFFIAVKLARAVRGISEVDEEELDDEEVLSFDMIFSAADDENENDYDAVVARSSMIDANGSTKIALVAMDRSIAAWRNLQISLPDKSDTIKPMLIDLERLRRLTEARFPHARDFIRPGFDEVLSAFVS